MARRVAIIQVLRFFEQGVSALAEVPSLHRSFRASLNPATHFIQGIVDTSYEVKLVHRDFRPGETHLHHLTEWTMHIHRRRFHCSRLIDLIQVLLHALLSLSYHYTITVPCVRLQIAVW